MRSSLLSPLVLAILCMRIAQCRPQRASHSTTKRATYDSSHKAGLSWTDTSVDVSQFLDKASWYYNWSPAPAYPVSAMDGLEYVPMFWGNKSIADFGGVDQLISAGGVDAVLGMNEPTTAGQSELSPAEAAQLWMQYLEPLKQANSSIRLGSPAMANGAAGIPWMQQFLGNCSSCSVDFTVVHYYYINSSDFISYLNGYHDAFQKPIWVTEWACVNYADPSAPCADSYIPQFMNETQSFMDSTDWVERYAWFGAFRTMPGGLSSALQLYDSNGKITALGKQYIGLGSSTSSGGGGGVNTGSSAPTFGLGISHSLALTFISLVVALLVLI